MRAGAAWPGVTLLLASALVMAMAGGSAATEIVADPAAPGGLAAALADAASGDVVRLPAGVYAGPVVIDKPLTLEGEAGAVIDGRGIGRTVEVRAPDVVLRGLTLRNSGISLAEEHAAIYLTRDAARARIEDNRIEHSLVGVWLKGSPDAIVRHNRIEGRADLRVNERGNGVYLWNAPGSQVIENTISAGRDGIFVNASRSNSFRGNVITGVRIAVHYMYTSDSEVIDNRSRGNHIGFALMYGDRMRVEGNRSIGDQEHGLMLNYANGSTVTGNVIENAAGRCVFLFNANKNAIAYNRFEGCDIGIYFTAGSEGNQIYENALIGNRTQVKYVGTRLLDWSKDGRGNYWSDNATYDLDHDGIADQPYKPNDLMDEVVWRAPLARALMTSPAVQVLRWAQARFPALHPGGIVDSAPLMMPPAGRASSAMPEASG